MKENNIQGIGKKKFKPITTTSNHDLPIAERIFETENAPEQVTRPNQFWGGDITYIPTEEGWLYLSIFMDLFTRKIVGHAMRATMHAVKSSTLPDRLCITRLIRRNHDFIGTSAANKT